MNVKRDEWRNGGQHRIIREADMVGIAIVARAAYSDSEITAIRHLVESARNIPGMGVVHFRPHLEECLLMGWLFGECPEETEGYWRLVWQGIKCWCGFMAIVVMVLTLLLGVFLFAPMLIY